MDVSSRNATGQVRETIRASGLINFWPSVRRMFPLPIIKHPEQRTTVASEHSSDPFLVFVFMKRSEQCSILDKDEDKEGIRRMLRGHRGALLRVFDDRKRKHSSNR